MQVAKTIQGSAFDVLLVAPPGDLDQHLENHQMELWLHNPSQKRMQMDSGSYVVGLDQCRAWKSDEKGFDAMGPSSVRWSLHRPGSPEQFPKTGDMEKDIQTDKAHVWVVLKGSSEPKRMTVSSAFAQMGCPPGSNVWGFKTVVDATKKVTLRPQANATVFVVPKRVTIVDATFQNAGFFIGLAQAKDTDKKMDLLRPELVLHPSAGGSSKGGLEPKPQSSMARFVAAKNLSVGPGQCVHLW